MKNVNLYQEDDRWIIVDADDRDYSPEDAIAVSEELIARQHAANEEYDAVQSILSGLKIDLMKPRWEAADKAKEALQDEVRERMSKAVFGFGSCYWHTPSGHETCLKAEHRTSDIKTSTYELHDRRSMDPWKFIYNGSYDQMLLHLTALAPRYGIEAKKP